MVKNPISYYLKALLHYYVQIMLLPPRHDPTLSKISASIDYGTFLVRFSKNKEHYTRGSSSPLKWIAAVCLIKKNSTVCMVIWVPYLAPFWLGWHFLKSLLSFLPSDTQWVSRDLVGLCLRRQGCYVLIHYWRQRCCVLIHYQRQRCCVLIHYQGQGCRVLIRYQRQRCCVLIHYQRQGSCFFIHSRV